MPLAQKQKNWVVNRAISAKTAHGKYRFLIRNGKQQNRRSASGFIIDNLN
jgi:hypothetical protein